MSGLRIIKTGLLAQLQDRGRRGYGDIGITQSGAADGYSAAWANRLLVNDPEAAVLEILLGGMVFVSEVDTSIALTGAAAFLRINGFLRALWRVHPLKRGERIEIGMAGSGLRLYLAVKGGFLCKKELGSCATTHREGLGRQVENGELLRCSNTPAVPLAATPQAQIPEYLDVMTLRVLPGYQYALFSSRQRANFFSTPYRVTQATDRMGCRLEGEPVSYEGGELISEPIAYGSIQIPNDGQPIVLLNERQTIGGYPKIGSVLPMDCYRLAQARPGTMLAFKEVDLEEAIEKTKALYAFMDFVSPSDMP